MKIVKGSLNVIQGAAVLTGVIFLLVLHLMVSGFAALAVVNLTGSWLLAGIAMLVVYCGITVAFFRAIEILRPPA